jgi:hypothetical protein
MNRRRAETHLVQFRGDGAAGQFPHRTREKPNVDSIGPHFPGQIRGDLRVEQVGCEK